MNIVVTAGNTQTPIDRVRVITNVFTGRTGAAIALEAHHRGHPITLLTSHPEVLAEPPTNRWRTVTYRTFAELRQLMECHVRDERPDVLIHCAAVSDYELAGVYSPAFATYFEPAENTWHAEVDAPRLVDRAAGKVKSDEPELWLRLVRAPKLVDLVRPEWGFRGVLVKFKLEVGVSDEELQQRAERSRRRSDADWVVANTLEGAADWALLGSARGYQHVARAELPSRLLAVVEGTEKCHG